MAASCWMAQRSTAMAAGTLLRGGVTPLAAFGCAPSSARSFATSTHGRNFATSTHKVLPGSRQRFKYRVPLKEGVHVALGGKKSDKVAKAAANMLRRPERTAEIMANLPVEERRKVALAWAMTELEEEFTKADKDRDGKLTYKEFKAWAFKAIESGPQRDTTEPPTRQQCIYVALGAIFPFMGFGMV